MSKIENPYESPRAGCGDLPQTSPVPHPHIHGRLTAKSPLYRRIELLEAKEEVIAVVEYDGWGIGYETVRVNGGKAATGVGRWGFATPIDFGIWSRRGVLAGRIEVKTACLLFLGGLRLLIDGCLVYSEGQW